MSTTPARAHAPTAAGVVVGAALAAALVAGCGGDGAPTDETDDSPPPSPTAGAVPALTESCDNPDDGYAISYPEGWQTNSGEVVSPCRLFDPEPVDVEPGTEIPFDVAVQLRVADRGFDAMLDLVDDDIGADVVERQATEVAGRDAVVVDSVATGETLLPEGVRTRTYYVDVDGATLIATTHDVGEPDFASKRAALDAMLGTLELAPQGDDGSPGGG